MAGRTPFIDLAYFDHADRLDSPPSVRHEINRFLTIDKQLYGIYSVIGDGIVNGWEVFDNGFTPSGGISIGISSGLGVIQSLASETTTPQYLNALPPNTTFSVYAILSGSTVVNRTVSFLISDSDESEAGIKIASVTTGDNSVETIDNSDREVILLQSQAEEAINNHKHTGTPSKIDLSSEVKNKLSAARIGKMGVDKLGDGRFSPSLVPSIKHSDLTGIGLLSHSQLDATIADLVNQGVLENNQRFMEVLLTNDLKRTLYLKTIKSDLDAYYENNFNYIPSISPDNFVDLNRTTAIIDKVAKCIVGPQIEETPLFFFTKNFKLPAEAVRVFIAANKTSVGEITFGVNTHGATKFSDYQQVIPGKVTTLKGEAAGGRSLKVGIRFVKENGPKPLHYPHKFGPYHAPLFNNNIIFDFQNTGDSAVFNFRVSFYSDVELENLVYSSDTENLTEGFSLDNSPFTLGGEMIPSGETVQVLYDPNDEPSIICGEHYFLKIEYHDGISWKVFSDTDTFKRYCKPSFTDFIDFSFTNHSIDGKDLHFRVRFYNDEERTDLYAEKFSLTNQDGWLINDLDNLGYLGYHFVSGQQANITYYPKASDFVTGKTYYLMIDAWDGTDFISENSEFVFFAKSSNSSCEQYATLPVVKNFSVIFELKNGKRTLLNI